MSPAEMAQMILRDVFAPDADPVRQTDAERLADAMFRDAGITLGTETARAMVRAGWRAPE
jgi:hypothetical protein